MALDSSKHSRSAPETARDWRPWLWAAALVLLVALVYWPTLWCGFVYDDVMHVQANETLRSPGGLRAVWFELGTTEQYYPMTHTGWWMQYQLWQLDPRGYHAVNLLMHATVVLLLWRLLVRLAVPGAWLAAALFAVHPVEVESVAFVSELKNLLSAALALGSLLTYLRFDPPEPRELVDSRPVDPSAKTYYVLAIVLYAAALLAKSVTASVPAVLLVIYWWKRGSLGRREIAPLVPMFVIGAAMAALTVWMETAYVGARGSHWELTPVDRVLLAGRALWFYAGKLAWPWPLMFFYPRWTIDSSVAWQYVFPVAAIAVIVALWLARARLGRGPLAAVLIFAGVLTPALGFFDVYPFLYSFVADHFQYHASMALLALAAAALVWLGQQFFDRPAWLAPALAVALLAPLAWIAQARTEVFADDLTLASDTLRQNPESWVSHHNLAICLQREGKHDEAIEHFRETLRLHPQHASAHNGLAKSLFVLDRLDETQREAELALAGELPARDRAIALIHLANVEFRRQEFARACERFRAAIALDPQNAEAVNNFILATRSYQDLNQTLAAARKLVTDFPASAAARGLLGELLLEKEEPQAALAQLRTAVQLEPFDARYRINLATACFIDAQIDEAERQLHEALRLEPRSADARNLLGVIRGQRGDFEGAIREFHLALAIDPQHPGATANLQKAVEARGSRTPPSSGGS